MLIGSRRRRNVTTAVVLGSCVAGALVAGAWAHAVRQAPSRIVVATVGTAFRMPLDGTVRTGVKLGPQSNGLRFENGVVSGVPATPMVMYAVADAAGVPASDTTWIVAFAPGLPMPSMPAQPYAYFGGSKTVPVTLGSGPYPRRVVSRERDSATANPTTDAGAALGRVLFYDRRLSVNDQVACASCHHQSMGFADSAIFSRGVAGVTKRHSMALANLRFNGGAGFFWDQRAASLEEQVLKPIQDSIEMGLTLADLSRKLNATDYYPALYRAAFGSAEITPSRTARALAQFLRSLVSPQSPFDTQLAPDRFGPDPARPEVTVLEGFRVFAASGCTGCHATNAQLVATAMNSGLDAAPVDSGAGRARFRPPSLRNVAVRPPYMHDGRFATLDEVIEFYSTQVNLTSDLDPRLRARDGVRRLRLTSREHDALLAFLNALTDSTFLTAKEFSDPFKPQR